MAKKGRGRGVKLILISLICILMLIALVPRARTVWELSNRKKELKREKLRLTQIYSEKKQQLKDLNTPAAMERIAREQLGMVKDGERVIIKVVPVGK